MNPGSAASASFPNARHTVCGDGQRGAVGLVGQAVQHPEHDEEDRHLRHHRQTRGHGIDLVILVELHHLFVELRLVVAMLVLQLAHLGREPLHLEHALGALQRERGGDRHDDGGDHRQHRHDVAVGQAVEPRQQSRWNLEHRSAALLGRSTGEGCGDRAVVRPSIREPDPTPTGRTAGSGRVDGA